jgi:hypothetical protein
MKIAKREINLETKSTNMAFVNLPHIKVCLDDLTPEIVTQLALFGLGTKLGNSFATNDGEDAAWQKCSAMRDQLMAGLWNAGRSSSGGILVEAIARATGKATSEVQELLKGKSDAQKADLRKHPKIKAAMAEITAERAAKLAEVAGETEDDVEELL